MKLVCNWNELLEVARRVCAGPVFQNSELMSENMPKRTRNAVRPVTP